MYRVSIAIGFFSLMLASSCKVAESQEKNYTEVSKYLPEEATSQNENSKTPVNQKMSTEVENPFNANGCINNLELFGKRRCPKYISYVCGCNNITYDNKCLAENAGVTKYKKGKCTSSVRRSGIKTAVR